MDSKDNIIIDLFDQEENVIANQSRPLQLWLEDANVSEVEFAQRIMLPLDELQRILMGKPITDIAVARRIMIETDNHVTLQDLLYYNMPSDHVSLIDFNEHRQNHINGLNKTLLSKALSNIFNDIESHSHGLEPSIFDIAAEATANTYLALQNIKDPQGQSLLLQALRPAISEIQPLSSAYADHHSPQHQDRLAQRVAENYLQFQ